MARERQALANVVPVIVQRDAAAPAGDGGDQHGTRVVATKFGLFSFSHVAGAHGNVVGRQGLVEFRDNYVQGKVAAVTGVGVVLAHVVDDERVAKGLVDSPCGLQVAVEEKGVSVVVGDEGPDELGEGDLAVVAGVESDSLFAMVQGGLCRVEETHDGGEWVELGRWW